MADAADPALLCGPLWINWSFGVASLTVLYYDYLLTLPDELAYIWSKRRAAPLLSAPTLLFVLVRYLAFFMHIPSAYALVGSHISDAACALLPRAHFYLSAFLQIIIGGIFILRIHALYRSRTVLLTLLAAGVGAIAVAFWAALHGGDSAPNVQVNYVHGCNPWISESAGRNLAVAWSGVAVFDVLVFGLTAAKALAARTSASALPASTLWRTFVRDGALYFASVFVVNVANIMALLFGHPVFKGAGSLCTTALSATLAARLLLNIRRAGAHDTRSRAGSGDYDDSSYSYGYGYGDGEGADGDVLSLVVTPSMLGGSPVPRGPEDEDEDKGEDGDGGGVRDPWPSRAGQTEGFGAGRARTPGARDCRDAAVVGGVG